MTTFTSVDRRVTESGLLLDGWYGDGRYDGAWDTGLPRFGEESFAHDTIPEGLDRVAPGPVLAAFLANVDVRRLSGYDRVVVLRAHQRMISYYQAKLYDDMVSIRDVFSDEGFDPVDAAMSGAAEIRCALYLARRTADVEMSFALDR